MEVILKDKQYKKVLLEVVKKNIEGSSEKNKTLIKRVVSDVKKHFNIDLKFILTYSVTIGGLIGPVYDIISLQLPNLSSFELSLITIGTIMTYYYNNRDILHNILVKIRDNNLINEFNLMLEKTETLKSAFFDFVKSLGVTFGSMSNILGFTFLLNVLNTLLNFADSNFSDFEAKSFVVGLTGYFGTLASKELTMEILTKMIKRFQGEKIN
jgi:hypothetical protein